MVSRITVKAVAMNPATITTDKIADPRFISESLDIRKLSSYFTFMLSKSYIKFKIIVFFDLYWLQDICRKKNEISA